MEIKMEIDDNDSNTIEETEKPGNVFANDPSDELSSGPLDTLLQPKDILEMQGTFCQWLQQKVTHQLVYFWTSIQNPSHSHHYTVEKK
jgi:hypothetical protein